LNKVFANKQSNQRRRRSLDVMRGLAVIGMIMVNGVAIFNADGQRSAYDILLHAHWNGVTLADLVFPFFIFIMGVSIPFALSRARETKGLSHDLLFRLLWRGMLLFLIGLILNFCFFDMAGERQFRIMGVLQRIGIVYTGAALIYVRCSFRWQMVIAAGLLLIYWGILLLPLPGGLVADLSVPGKNFSHWTDHLIFGGHIYRANVPFPYDPEGLLGNLSAMAQALIGILIGQRIKRQFADYRTIFLTGIMLIFVGWLWGFYVPLNKSLWSSSFVFFTSGLAIITLVILIYVIDLKGWGTGASCPAEAFGMNALTGYIFHTLNISYILFSPSGLWLYQQSLRWLPEKTAMLPVIFLALFVTWLPMAILQWRKIYIRI